MTVHVPGWNGHTPDLTWGAGTRASRRSPCSWGWGVPRGKDLAEHRAVCAVRDGDRGASQGGLEGCGLQEEFWWSRRSYVA